MPLVLISLKSSFAEDFASCKVLPIATLADGHSIRFRVPAPGATTPTSYPGLSDTRLDVSTLWSGGSSELYMRDFNTSTGF
jgi:hypothetical protein